jgi:hypothetical protein
MSLRTCPDIKTTKELDCYPSPEAIQKLELLYGDALSKEDLDGRVNPPLNSSLDSARTASTMESLGGGGGGGNHLENSFLSSSASMDLPAALGHHSRRSRLEPTDSHNFAFEEIIRARDPSVPRVDRLQEQRVSPILLSIFHPLSSLDRCSSLPSVSPPHTLWYSEHPQGCLGAGFESTRSA